MNKYLAIYGKPRYLGIIACDSEINKGTYTVVESHRGEELAIVAGLITPEQEKQYRQMKNTSEHGDANVKSSEPMVTDLKFICIASDDDLKERDAHRNDEKEILKQAKELLVPQDLDIKLIDVELLRGKHKLFIYFSAEQRVDFRAYVRDLAREFKTRIELRQIGVRDEAKIIRGIGPCGNPCCCSYWLDQFAPIGIKMVKEQNLALNPAKISGICGRLMCCMCFEHNVYKEVWSSLPNPGSKIKTPNGNVVLSGVDVSTKEARFYVPEHGEVRVPIDRFAEFKETVSAGKEWVTEDESTNSKASQLPEFHSLDNADLSLHSESSGRHSDADDNNDTDKTTNADRDRQRRKKHRPRSQHRKENGKETSSEQKSEQKADENKSTADRTDSSEHRPSRRPRRRRPRGRKNQQGQTQNAVGEQPTGA